MPDADALFTPLRMGEWTLPNRIVMAPLTRCRAGPGNIPTPLNAEYYRQRASAGLIISEATPICPEGHGYPSTPGVHTPDQIKGWRLVTDAVHRAGGRIVCQLWHVGRVSHPAYQPGGGLPVAPSALGGGGEARLPDGTKAPRPLPRALHRDEIPGIIETYRAAAARALDAGFDGVELHGANGYLPDQFLRASSNQRQDDYGGPIERRARFMLEAARACVDVWGPGRVGVRLSPSGEGPGLSDPTPRETFGFVVRELDAMRVAYLHIMEAWPGSTPTDAIPVGFFRPLCRCPIIANSGFTRERAAAVVGRGDADAVAFGRLFISNPDLPERLRQGAALTPPDETTFYSSGPRGYTDYPAMARSG